MSMRQKFIWLIVDPSSGQLSMSRLGLGFMLLVNAAWVGGCIRALFLPHPDLSIVAPVSSMLGVITGAICTVYVGNSAGRVIMDRLCGSDSPVATNPTENPEGA